MTHATSEAGRAMTPRWTWAGDLLGRIGIVVVFTLSASAKLRAVVKDIQEWSSASPDFDILRLFSGMACLAFLALVVSTTVMRLKPLRSAEGIEPRAMALAGTFATVLVTLIPSTIPLLPALKIFALCLTATGFSLAAYVLYWLGRSFSIMAEARRLVTAGPYGIVRHPLYSVEEIAVIGILLLNLSLPAVLLIAVQWTIQMRRMHHEERVLSQTFPEYADYAARTPKFLPRLTTALARKPA
jgi:protein-S-isoprenylcysteine O-methyltransferase Ste14